MKKKILTLIGIVCTTIVIGKFVQTQFVSASVNSLLSVNIEALSNPENTTYQNGPQKKYDCTGWFTGNGYRCAAEIQTNCEPIPCK